MVKRGLFLIGILLIGFIFAAPNLIFVNPTPEDSLYVKITDPIINVSLNNDENTSVWLDWNNSLIGYWSFDYYNSTGVYDNSSYGNFGIFEGNLTSSNITSGIRGNALDFKRTNRDRVNVGNINVWENFTLSAWVYRTDNLDYRSIFGADGADNFYLTLMDNDSIMVQQGGIPWTSISAGGVTENQWHHVVLTHNSNNWTEIYVDGSLGNNGSIPFYSDNSTISRIGAFASVYNFEGSIDEVMIFNRTLSPEEILYLYNSTESLIEFNFQNLSDGLYPYSVYAINGSGELEIESRTFGIDSIPTGIDFVFPTPANKLYLKITNPTVNVSMTQSENKSVWIDWDNSLVGYWSFDNYNSTGVYDNSSYSNFGVFEGNLGQDNLTAGARGHGLKFNGIDSSLDLEEHVEINVTNQNYTVSLWAYKSNDSELEWNAFLGGNTGGSGGYWMYHDYGQIVFYQDYYDLEVYIWESGIDLGDELSYDSWEHLVFKSNVINYTYSNLTVIVNGGEYSSSGILEHSPRPETLFQVRTIGSSSVPSRFFNGSIDEVMVFNRSLSEEEILGIYNSTSSYFEFPQQNLENEGNYEYSVYSMDIGGNMEKISRNFTIDNIDTGLELIFPTPENELYTRITSQTINATFSEPENKSVFFDWNNSLKGYWSFDYVNSAGVYDNSSYDFHGTYRGNLGIDKLIAGPRGQAMRFENGEDYLRLTDSNELDLINFTFSTWVYYTGEKTNYNCIYSRPNTFKIWISGQDGDLYVQQGGTPGFSSIDANSALVPNRWHHVVVSHDSNNWTEIYVDGIEMKNGSLYLEPDSSSRAYLGEFGGGERLDGGLDEAMIFDRVLSEEEILYLYNSTASIVNYSKDNLSEGNYEFSVYSIDKAGNMEIESRNFTVDTTSVSLSFLYPSPSDGLYTYLTSQTVNVSLSETENVSSWVDWDNSLVGYWSFDYYNSTGVYDNSSRSNDGIFEGNLGTNNLTAGVRGYAMNFGDSGNYVTIPHSDSVNLDSSSSYSVSLWYKSSGIDLYDNIFAKYAGGTSYPFRLEFNTFGYLFFMVDNRTHDCSSSFNFATDDGEWHHVVGQMDFDLNQTSIYHDGELIDFDSCELIGHFNSSVDFSIGSRGESLYFNGSIDEVMIFNRSLSSDEVLALYGFSEGNFESSVSNLEEGEHNYSVYSMDQSGNLLIESREFTVDTTGPGLDLFYPTPSNNLYSKLINHTINVTFSEPENKSVFFDWNNSLLGYWSFDYYNSTGVYDNSSYGNFGEFRNSLTLDSITTGVRGQGLYLNGDDNLILIPFSTSHVQENFTLSIWAKNTLSNVGNWGHIFGFDSTSMMGPGFKYERFMSSNGTHVFNINYGLATIDEEWNHFLVLHDSSTKTLKAYINGVYFGNVTYTQELTDEYSELEIGAGSDSFNGTIDEAMIFGRVLSEEEILYLYNSTASIVNYSKDNLSEGNYEFSVYSIDKAGNMEIESRNFTVDTTSVSLSFLYPSPSDGLYTYLTSQTVNVSLSETENVSSWVDWDNSLVGYWSFDYYNSTGVYDNSSYGNFGTFNGGLDLNNLETGARGQGLEFERDGGYLEMEPENFNFTSKGFSFGGWINHEDSSWYSSHEFLFGRGDHWSTSPYYLSAVNGSIDVAIGAEGCDSWAVRDAGIYPLPQSGWHHVFLNVNSTGAFLYLDGVQVYGSSFSGELCANDFPFRIGLGNLDPDSGFNGTIDEVMVFNRSLSLEEILYLYNSTSTKFEYSVSGLEERTYNYSFYSIDRAGNLLIESREFTVDTIGPGLELVFPTPEDGLYTQIVNQTINFTFDDPNNKSFWLDWNNSLLGYWSFDYLNETGVFDNSSYERFGISGGGLGFDDLDSGVRGKGIKLDGGSSTGFEIPFSNFSANENFTLSVWAKNTLSNRGWADAIFGFDESYTSGPVIYYDTLRVYNGTTLFVVDYVEETVDEEWNHFLVLHDSSIKNIEVYINGAFVGNTSYGAEINDPQPNMRIGGDNGYTAFNGTIDEAMIFGRVLNEEEILYLYNSTLSEVSINKTDLEDASYNYSIYSIDQAGNMEIESRNFTVDTENAIHTFEESSLPESGGTNGTFIFNVSIEDLSPTSSWYDLDNSLIGYWAFDYTNSTGVFDNSSHGDHSSFALFEGNSSEENLTFSSRGNGIHFDGAQDYLKIVNSSRFNFTDEDFSFGGWIKRDNFTAASSIAFGKGSSASVTPYSIWVMDSRARLLLGVSGCSFWESSGSVQTSLLENNTWYHVFVTKEGILVKMYLDGVEVSSLEIENETICSRENSFVIGAGSYGEEMTNGYFPGYVDEVMVFNRSLSSQEILALYDSNVNEFIAEYTVLENKTHNYSFSTVDKAGNFEKFYRSFDVDKINPLISYENSTSENNSYNGVLNINATIYERNLKNVTFNFGGSSYVLNITEEYSLNSKNYTDVFINATRVDNSTNKWELIIKRTGLALGQSYWYNVEIYDDGHNYNFTSSRIIHGNNPPQFYPVIQSPNTTLDLDPGVLVNITVNITDMDSDLDSYHLEWKKSGENWTNVSLTEISGTLRSKILYSNFTPTSEGIYTYRFFAEDEFGVTNYSNEVNLSVYWDCEWRVNSSFDALAGYGENKRLGTLVIENLGDSNYSNNNCTLNFRTTYDLEERRVYFDNYYFKDQTFLGLEAKDSLEILVNVTFGSEFTQEDLTITTTEIGGISTSTSAETTTTLITLSSGPYLYNEITESPSAVYLTPQNFELEGYTRNLLGSPTPNETNTAYNVSFYWSIPEGFTETAENLYYENISDSSANQNPTTISFEDLSSFVPGVKTFYLVSEGKNLSGDFIRDSSGNALITDSVEISFLCYSISDSICVSECGNSLDPDCPVETVVIETTTGGSGGGGGGTSTPEFKISEDRFELVIGEKQEFPLKIENVFNYPKEKVKVIAQGLDETEIEINPSIISRIAPKSSKEVRVTLTSKKYLTQGFYEIVFYVEGFINRDGKMESFREKKVMQLFLVEISKQEAEKMINESFEILKKMQEENLSVRNADNFIKKMNSSLSLLDYGGVEEEYQVLSELFEVASASKEMIEELEKSISRSEKYGISVLEAKKTFYIAKSALERGDYYLAYQKVKEAQLTYALETKGKFNIVKYVQNEPINSAVIFFSFILVLILTNIVVRYFVYKRKIENFSVEEKLILELMKVIQKQCFEESKLSMGQYGEAIAQYESKLAKTVQRKVEYESKLINLTNFKGKKRALLHEQKRLTDLIKGIQEDYMVKGKLETRIYEGMVKSYSSRLTEVEEKLIYMEASKALRGKGFFKALFRRKKNEKN